VEDEEQEDRGTSGRLFCNDDEEDDHEDSGDKGKGKGKYGENNSGEDDGDRGTSGRPLKMSSNPFHSWLVVVIGIPCSLLYFHWAILWCLRHMIIGRWGVKQLQKERVGEFP